MCVKAKDETSCIVKGPTYHPCFFYILIINLLPHPTKKLHVSPDSIVFINPVFAAAGNAFCQAARLHIQLQNKLDSATSFVDAGNAYKKADPQGECITISLTHSLSLLHKSAAVMRFFSSQTAGQGHSVDIKFMGVIISVFVETNAQGFYLTGVQALYN